jgi:hypothetical protein
MSQEPARTALARSRAQQMLAADGATGWFSGVVAAFGATFFSQRNEISMKVMLRVTLSPFLAFFGFACNSRSENQPPQTKMVNAADLKPSEIQRDQLSEDQLRRIKKLRETFAEVDSSSLEKWIDNFKRDADPDSEIAIWERVAVAYTNYCSQRQLTLEAKGDVFQALVLRSMTSDEEAVKTLKLKVLSADEARKIMREY